MFEKLVAKLRAIPALGVARFIEHYSEGVVPRLYQYKAVLVNYDGIEQVLAFTDREWTTFQDNAFENNLKCKTSAVVVKQSYMTKIGNKTTPYDSYVVKVEYMGYPITLAMRPCDLKKAVDHGLKVSVKNKFRVGWFKKLIRKIGLAIFG